MTNHKQTILSARRSDVTFFSSNILKAMILLERFLKPFDPSAMKNC